METNNPAQTAQEKDFHLCARQSYTRATRHLLSAKQIRAARLQRSQPVQEQQEKIHNHKLI